MKQAAVGAAAATQAVKADKKPFFFPAHPFPFY